MVRWVGNVIWRRIPSIATPKHLKSGVWKYFGFYTLDGKVTNKNKAVCRLSIQSRWHQICNLTELAFQSSEAAEEAPQGVLIDLNELRVTLNLFELDFFERVTALVQTGTVLSSTIIVTTQNEGICFGRIMFMPPMGYSSCDLCWHKTFTLSPVCVGTRCSRFVVHCVLVSSWSPVLVRAPGMLRTPGKAKDRQAVLKIEQRQVSSNTTQLQKKPMCGSNWSVVTFCILVPQCRCHQ